MFDPSQQQQQQHQQQQHNHQQTQPELLQQQLQLANTTNNAIAYHFTHSATRNVYDWYQTNTHVIINIMIKNLKEADVKVKLIDETLDVTCDLADGSVFKLHFNLFKAIYVADSNWSVTPSKLEIKLKKTDRKRWQSLELIPEKTKQRNSHSNQHHSHQSHNQHQQAQQAQQTPHQLQPRRQPSIRTQTQTQAQLQIQPQLQSQNQTQMQTQSQPQLQIVSQPQSPALVLQQQEQLQPLQVQLQHNQQLSPQIQSSVMQPPTAICFTNSKTSSTGEMEFFTSSVDMNSTTLIELVDTSNPESTGTQRTLYDWYQTNSHVIINIMIKNLKEADVKVKLIDETLDVTCNLADGSIFQLHLDLYKSISVQDSSWTVTPSKLEIRLKKGDSKRWQSLEKVPEKSNLSFSQSDEQDDISEPSQQHGEDSQIESHHGHEDDEDDDLQQQLHQQQQQQQQEEQDDDEDEESEQQTYIPLMQAPPTICFTNNKTSQPEELEFFTSSDDLSSTLIELVDSAHNETTVAPTLVEVTKPAEVVSQGCDVGLNDGLAKE